MALYKDDRATLDDIREAVTTLEDAERTARRVFGGAHPTTSSLVKLREPPFIATRRRRKRPRIRARETGPLAAATGRHEGRGRLRRLLGSSARAGARATPHTKPPPIVHPRRRARPVVGRLVEDARMRGVWKRARRARPARAR